MIEILASEAFGTFAMLLVGIYIGTRLAQKKAHAEGYAEGFKAGHKIGRWYVVALSMGLTPCAKNPHNAHRGPCSSDCGTPSVEELKKRAMAAAAEGTGFFVDGEEKADR